MERAVEGGQAAAYPEFGFSAGGRGADFGLAAAPRGRGGGACSIAPDLLQARHHALKLRHMSRSGGEGGEDGDWGRGGGSGRGHDER